MFRGEGLVNIKGSESISSVVHNYDLLFLRRPKISHEYDKFVKVGHEGSITYQNKSKEY